MENVENFMVIDLNIWGALCIAASVVIAGWAAFRRKPPIEAEFATNERLNEVERRLEDKIDALSNRMNGDVKKCNDDLFKRLNEVSASLEAKLGSLQNQLIDILKEAKK
jgi:uncharacterized protein YPO0396